VRAAAKHTFVSSQNILQRSTTPQILLLQTQLLSGGGIIVGVKDPGNGLGALGSSYGALVISSVERLQVETSNRFCAPKTDVVDYMTTARFSASISR
jgi:hypothetical protein